MTEFVHEVRNSVTDGTRVYRLESDGLSWRDGERQERRPYTDFAAVHLISYPNYGGLHLQATLTDRAGKTTKIRSHHYVSLGRFEDRCNSYGPFIQELVARLGTQGRGVTFHSGSNVMRVIWTALFWLSVAITVGLVFALIGGFRPGWGSVGVFASVLAFLPVSRAMMGRSIAGTFDPKAPPADFLGQS